MSNFKLQVHSKLLKDLQSCHCYHLGPYQVREFCVAVRYLLNYCVVKMCVEDNLLKLLDFEIKTLDEYLKCELHFFNHLTNKVEIKMNNPDLAVNVK